MATIKNVKVIFTADFSNRKNGDVDEFSNDISNILINDLKVAKLHEVKEVKTKKSK